MYVNKTFIKNIKLKLKFLASKTTHVNYGLAILDKKFHNKRVFKEGYFFYNDEIEKIWDYINKENINKLVEESDFLSEKLRKRYKSISSLISYGMASEYYGRPLTRTGKTYRTFNEGSIRCSNYASNTFVRIFEAKSKIQIEARMPMAIVEFIEEVNNERKIRDEEFKQKSKKVFISCPVKENSETFRIANKQKLLGLSKNARKILLLTIIAHKTQPLMPTAFNHLIFLLFHFFTA